MGVRSIKMPDVGDALDRGLEGIEATLHHLRGELGAEA